MIEDFSAFWERKLPRDFWVLVSNEIELWQLWKKILRHCIISRISCSHKDIYKTSNFNCKGLDGLDPLLRFLFSTCFSSCVWENIRKDPSFLCDMWKGRSSEEPNNIVTWSSGSSVAWEDEEIKVTCQPAWKKKRKARGQQSGMQSWRTSFFLCVDSIEWSLTGWWKTQSVSMFTL